MNTNIHFWTVFYALRSNVLLIYLIKLVTDSLFLCALYFSNLNEVISCFKTTRTTVTSHIYRRRCVNNPLLNNREKSSLQNHGFMKRTDKIKRIMSTLNSLLNSKTQHKKVKTYLAVFVLSFFSTFEFCFVFPSNLDTACIYGIQCHSLEGP